MFYQVSLTGDEKADSGSSWADLDRRFSTFKNASEDMMLCDSHDGKTTGGPAEGTKGFAAVYCPHCYSSPPYDLVNYGLSSRHRGGPNCLFVDGHVKWYPVQQALDTGPRSIWAHAYP